VRAAVTYYYVLPHDKPDFSHMRAAVLGHLGASDEFVPVEAAQALEAELRDAGVRARFEYYPALPRFVNDSDRLGPTTPRGAQRSWASAIEFLRHELER
jgi:carboxymethylenebutenolidase